MNCKKCGSNKIAIGDTIDVVDEDATGIYKLVWVRCLECDAEYEETVIEARFPHLHGRKF